MTGSDLVTGGTGFIGGHVVRRLLANGRAVRALCRPGSETKIDEGVRTRIEIASGDLADRTSLERAVRGASRVFHCAGEVSDWGDEERFAKANVRGTRWLFESARAAGTERAVHMSSFVVFGVPPPPEFDDASPYGSGRDAYTRTKIDGEKAVLALARETGFRVAVLRPAVVYGPGGMWLEEPKRMMMRRAFFLIGHGAGTCHPSYIETLVDAAILAAEHPAAPGRAFLVGDDDPISFRDYFAAVGSLAGGYTVGRSIPTTVARGVARGLEGFARLTRAGTRPLLTRTAVDFVTTPSRMSIRRIREELGFKPRLTFREAIDAMRSAGS